MTYKTDSIGENAGSDSVGKENENTGNKSFGNAENKTDNKEKEHQFSVEEQNESQRQR